MTPNSLKKVPASAAIVGHGEEQVLDGDIFVFEFFRLVFSFGEQAVEPACWIEAIGCLAAARDARQFFDLAYWAMRTTFAASGETPALLRMAGASPFS